MNGTDIIGVSAAVVALTHLIKWSGVSSRHAPLVVLTLSMGAVALWAYTTDHVSRADAFGLFAGWIAVASSASGVFGFSIARQVWITTGVPRVAQFHRNSLSVRSTPRQPCEPE
jgi:hypothetical protein